VCVPAGARFLGAGDLLESAAEVEGGCAGALLRPPGDRPVEGEVELEDARAVAEPGQPPRVALGKPVARQAEQLPRGDVQQDRGGTGELPEGRDGSVALDVASE
jgi:hypothetical protein